MKTFMTQDQIVADLIDKLTGPDEAAAIAEFLATPFDELSKYHHGFGTTIRNEYGLWDDDHPLNITWQSDITVEGNPFIVNGVDMHPLHPDNRSMTIIEEFWNACKNQ